jgi:glutathione transport system substrate-binding protein
MNQPHPFPMFRPRASFVALAGAFALTAAVPAFAQQNVVVAVYSTFTTLDPYDANDTVSQAVVKSFYEGLFGFDKDMKLVNVLADRL